MFRLFCKIIVLFFSYGVFAQSNNLVPNPSFEEYSTCPTNVSTAQDMQINYTVTHWYAPSTGTSDYFNECAVNTNADVPVNYVGNQYPFEGNAYAGFVYYYSNINSTSHMIWFEYLQVKLKKSLQKDVFYKMSFYVSLAEISFYAVNHVGAWLTPNQITSNDAFSLFSKTPQVYNQKYIADTMVWKKVEGLYLAKGGEQYLTIGFWVNTNNMDTLNISENQPSDVLSYYYVDNVICEKVDVNTYFPNVFTPNNDGVNDMWSPKFNLENYKVSIFNRWGKLIKEGDAYNFVWDGTMPEGNDCPEGVYYFIIRKNQNEDNLKDNQSSPPLLRGFIQLLR